MADEPKFDEDTFLASLTGPTIDSRISFPEPLYPSIAEKPITIRVRIDYSRATFVEPRAILRESVDDEFARMAQRFKAEERFATLTNSGRQFVAPMREDPEPIVARFPVVDSDFIKYADELEAALVASLGIPAELLQDPRAVFPLYVEQGKAIGVVRAINPTPAELLEAEVILAPGVRSVTGFGFALFGGSRPAPARWSHAMRYPNRGRTIGQRRRRRVCKRHKFDSVSRVCVACGTTAEQVFFGKAKRWKRKR